MKEALKLLRKSGLTESLLMSRLEVLNRPQTEIESVVTQLKAWGFLNDTLLVDNICSLFIAKHKGGRIKLQLELEAKGIDSEEAASIASEVLPPEEERSLAEEILRKSRPKNPGQAYRKLVRLGFEPESAESFVNWYFASDAE